MHFFCTFLLLKLQTNWCYSHFLQMLLFGGPLMMPFSWTTILLYFFIFFACQMIFRLFVTFCWYCVFFLNFFQRHYVVVVSVKSEKRKANRTDKEWETLFHSELLLILNICRILKISFNTRNKNWSCHFFLLCFCSLSFHRRDFFMWFGSFSLFLHRYLAVFRDFAWCITSSLRILKCLFVWIFRA